MSEASMNVAGRLQELKVTGNLMTLESGIYCLIQNPGTVAPPRDGSGLPGVRISVAPVTDGAAKAQVTIRGLHEDGWLGPRDGAALVRVLGGPAQILITVYQSPHHPMEAAPRLQVVPISGEGAAAGAAPAPVPVAASRTGTAARGKTAPATSRAGDEPEVVAHVQRTGDVSASLGAWMGTQGSTNWIEGFSIAPREGVTAEEIEYQAVLGRGWLSPWVSGGKFCGSRGMALPLLGFNLRLRGKAAERFTCSYSASFVDGTRIGPLQAGQSCEAPNLAPLESFQVTLSPRNTAAARAKIVAKPAAKAPAKPVRKAPAKAATKAPKKAPATAARKRGR